MTVKKNQIGGWIGIGLWTNPLQDIGGDPDLGADVMTPHPAFGYDGYLLYMEFAYMGIYLKHASIYYILYIKEVLPVIME